MKYYKRLKRYKASNVELCAETFDAYSYGWWKFVTLLADKKTLVFNNYSYSRSTSKHQSKVADLLHRLGVTSRFEVLHVRSPRSIGNHEFYASCVQVLQNDIDSLKYILSNSRRKRSLDGDRYARLAELTKELARLETYKDLL